MQPIRGNDAVPTPPLPRRVQAIDGTTAFALPEAIEAEFTEVPPRRLRDYLRIVSTHRRLAAACLVGTVVFAALVTWRSPRLYSAAVRLQVARNSPIKLQLKDNVLNLDETDRVINGASSFLTTQVQALRSRDLAERVLRDIAPADTSEVLERGRPTAALAPLLVDVPPFLRPRGLDITDVAGAPHNGAATHEAVAAPLIDTYLGYLDVQEVRGTDLVDIRFLTPGPALSAVLAAAHAQAYLGANADAQLVTDAAAVDFLEQQLQQAKGDLNRTDLALRQFATEHPNVAINQEHDLVGKQIQELSTRMGESEAQRAEAQTRYEFLTKSKREPLAHFFDASPSMQQLRLALLNVEEQRAVLKMRLGPNHAQMIELRHQAAELALQLDNEIDQEIGAAKARFAAARLHEQELREQLRGLEAMAVELRNLGAQYELLKADHENARALHDSLLRQKTETAVHSQLAASNVRVIERPEAPEKPSRPSLPVNLALGAIAGTLIAGAAVFVREALDHSVKSTDEVVGLLQLPTLAVIPNFVAARSNGASALTKLLNGHAPRRNGTLPVRVNGTPPDLVVLREPWSLVAESFRALRTAVLFSNPTTTPQLLVLTSAAAGEGKTVSTLNLAATLAEAGWRVLVIDGDLRSAACHDALGVANRRGLSNYLSGQCDLDGIIHQLATPRFAFVPAGPPPPNPAELIGSERMHVALQTLRGRYDFVLIDSPPVLAVTDGVILGRQADAVVLVVKGRSSRRELVRRARDQLSHAGAHLLGVLVNDVDLSWGDFAFYEDYRGYRRTSPPSLQELSA